MSYQTEAVLFWGFTLPYSDEADRARDAHVEQRSFGSDGCLTHYLCIKQSLVGAELDGFENVDALVATADVRAWAYLLSAFCVRHNIAHRPMGWHLAASRI